MNELIEAMGWTKIDSKTFRNPYLKESYRKDNKRLNIYTSGTITIQSTTEPIIVLRNATLDTLESVL